MFLATVLVCWAETAESCEAYTVSMQPLQNIEECYGLSLGAAIQFLERGVTAYPVCHYLEIGELS